MGRKYFHKGKYYVSFKCGFEDYKKDITITLDKIFESDTLIITLSDDEDPTFLCLMNLTRCDYEDLKKRQGLLIDFDNFPAQVVRLLQQCASTKMFLIIHQINPMQYNFEIVEHNEFKRLVHLSLTTGPATDTDIKKHMADTISDLKRNLMAIKSSASNNEMLWTDKCARMEAKIIELSSLISKMEEEKSKHEIEFQETIKIEKDRLLQEKTQWQKSNDINMKNIIVSNQENLNMKDKQIDDLNNLSKQLRENIVQIENQLSDKNQRIHMLEKEVQKTHIEVATLKAKNATLDREVAEKDRQSSQLTSKLSYLEKTEKDNAEVIKKLNESIQAVKKEKISLERRLSLSESLANKNTEAANSTTEQLLKANQIISKLNNDLLEMKDKLLCRTAIALEQEKVIDQNMKDIESLKSEVSSSTLTIDKLKTELDMLRKKYDSTEEALKERDETIKNNNMVIQWLHKKLDDNCLSSDNLQNKNNILSATSSTPYFITRNNTSTHGTSDESINFYANSKISEVDESPCPKTAAPSRAGLDPKYLQPASNDNQIKKGKDIKRTNSTSQSQRGKENKNTELPTVNYREKKSSKGTYRATPVSAYFP